MAPTHHVVIGTATLEALLAQSLDERWERYLLALTKAQKNPSERQVHDVRVATRRLISTIDLFRTVLSDTRLQEIRGVLKSQLKVFNPLRDVQVQLQTVEQMLPTNPVLEPVHTILLLRERRLIKAIGKRFSRVPHQKLKRDLRAVKRQLNALLCTFTARDIAFAAVLGTATIAFARAVELRRLVDPANAATIHKLRIAFKKVRYILEALQPVFSGVTDQQLRAMNDFQQLMGDVQDVEVLRATIDAYAVQRHRTRDVSLRTVQRRLLRRRDQCVQKFLRSADALFSFWHQEFKPRVLLHPSAVGAKDGNYGPLSVAPRHSRPSGRSRIP